MKKVFVVLSLVLVAAVALQADVYIKAKSHTDAVTVMGQTTPATDTVTEQWMGDDKIAIVSTGMTFVVDLKKNAFYYIIHGSKSYVESPLPIDMSKLVAPEVAGMMGMMKVSMTVAPTTETKKVGQWDCTGYDVTMTMMGMPMKMRVWASTAVPFDTAKFNALYGTVMKGQSFLDDASVKEMMKIKGYQVASEMNAEMMGAKIHTTTETVEIGNKPAPAGIYGVPAGYAKKANLTMEDMQNMRK